MIHFDFIVDDEDAENIFDAIRNEATLAAECSRETFSESEREWFTKRASYLRSLIVKMKNTRIGK